ncbi:aldehyde dehydrogenase family protein [Methylopila sp. Yamaguchi]|uniref:aldehyde dehydrogenase family protein n=1 Tax=Methylopila sp. Yamaguchi TaxID=1437817 RepID=UPI001FCF280B|nr:aldehyde dehydrogenase family protein [Methylopila sp. Yamaguchi]
MRSREDAHERLQPRRYLRGPSCAGDDAIRPANDNEYGLAASIWTREVDRSLRAAQAANAGSVWIIDWAKVYDGTEKEGFKQAGLGRLDDLAALGHFVEH